MIVISDTSPLCYLVSIGLVELLPQLYDRVIIPDAVARELSAAGAPAIVQNWIAQPPDWLQIRAVVTQPDAELKELGAGEREGILLAEDLGYSLLLLDDMEARNIARRRGVKITGLLGVLSDASTMGLTDFSAAIALLQQTTFRASSSLIQSLLERHRENGQK